MLGRLLAAGFMSLAMAGAAAADTLVAKTLTGRSIEVDVTPEDTVETVRLKVAEKADLTLDEVRLLYKGEPLEDEKTLKDYGIEDGATVTLVLRLPG